MTTEADGHGSIVGWLVWSHVGDECDYYIFTEFYDAKSKHAEFDADDPDGEHGIEALTCHPNWTEEEQSRKHCSQQIETNL